MIIKQKCQITIYWIDGNFDIYDIDEFKDCKTYTKLLLKNGNTVIINDSQVRSIIIT